MGALIERHKNHTKNRLSSPLIFVSLLSSLALLCTCMFPFHPRHSFNVYIWIPSPSHALPTTFVVVTQVADRETQFNHHESELC